jgi:undecaprenyl diphosphate synthase
VILCQPEESAGCPTVEWKKFQKKIPDSARKVKFDSAEKIRYISWQFSFFQSRVTSDEGRDPALAKGSQQPSSRDRKAQEELRAAGEIPRHIAIIMDGNGRWAKKRGRPRISGHAEGVESVRDVVGACGELGVRFLTLYAFSTENWKRPKEEVSLLMRLLLKALRDETDRLNSNNVRLRVVGDIQALPGEVQSGLLESIQKTASNSGLTLVLALSYSGRWDITQAAKRLAVEVASGQLMPEGVTEEEISGRLSTAGIPDPDLLIRTSGELRISNFLLWQLAYSEFHVTRKFWPDFRRDDLYEAITEYQGRERRFGMVSDQVRGSSAGKGRTGRYLRSVTGP